MPLTTCPAPVDLRDFRLGKLSTEAARQIAEHLDGCSTCQANIETISDSDDTLVHALRQPPPADGYQDEPELQKALAGIEVLGTQFHSQTSAGEGNTKLDVESLGALRDYQLLEMLGEGGMGAVYKARHQRLKRTVAVKLLPQDRTRDKRAVARFEREMEAVGKLEHPNIVRALDAGEHDGTHYLVMEYVDGLDLSEVVRRVAKISVGNALRGVPDEDGAAVEDVLPSPSRKQGDGLGRPSSGSGLRIADACELVRQAAAGLQCAHEHGLVHRDIKPSNVMLNAAGQVKILDLGLALLLAEQPGGEELTGTSQMMGTADYCAPEQAGDSHTVDIRADIYSLGCTLFKLLTGHAPFTGEQYNTTMKKLIAHTTLRVPAVHGERPDVPEGLSQVLDRMLAKSPAARYSTPAEVLEAISPFCGGSDLKHLYAECSAPADAVAAAPAMSETTPQFSSALAGTHPEGTGNRAQGTEDNPVGNTLSGVGGEQGLQLPLPPRDGRGEGILLPLPPGEGRGEGGLQRARATHSADVTTETYIGRRPPRRGLLIAAAAAALVLIAGIVIVVRDEDGKVIGKMEVPDGATFSIEPTGNKDAKPLDKPAPAEKAATPIEKPAPKQPTPPPAEPPKPSAPRESQTAEALPDFATTLTAFDTLKRSDIPPYELAIAGNGDPEQAPKELVAILGDSRLKHWHAVRRVDFTRDGKTVVSAGSDGAVRVWDAITGRQRSVVTLPTSDLSVAVHPDGQSFAVGIWATGVGVYDVATAERQHLVPTFGGEVAWSPDGTTLVAGAYGGSGEIALCDLAAGKAENIAALGARVLSLKFGPAGRLLVAAGDNAVRLWNMPARELRAASPAAGHEIYNAAISPDGRTIAVAGGDLAVKLWDIDKAEIVGSLTAPSGIGLRCADWSPDGATLVSAGFGAAQIWELSGRKLVRQIATGDADVSAVKYGPDSRRLALAGADGVVRLVDATNGQPIVDTAGHQGQVNDLAICADGQTIVTASFDHTANVWDVATRSPPETLRGHEAPLYSVAISRDGKAIITGVGSPAFVPQLWNASTGELNREFAFHDNTIESLAFSRDGRKIASGDGSSVARLWDVASNKELWRAKADISYLRAIAVSPDGGLVAAGGTGAVKLWNAETGELKRVLKQPGNVTSLSFSNSGDELLSASDLAEGGVRLWDVSTGEVRRVLGVEVASGALSADFSPDGRTIAASYSDGKVRLWDPDPPRGKSALKQTITLGPPGGLIRKVRFSPEGRHLVTLNGNGTIYVLRLAEPPVGAKLAELSAAHPLAARAPVAPKLEKPVVAPIARKRVPLQPIEPGTSLSPMALVGRPATRAGVRSWSIESVGHRSAVFNVAYSPDGRWLASAGFDGTVRLIDTATRKPVRYLIGHTADVHALAWSPDSQVLASGGYDKMIRFWDVASGSLLKSVDADAQDVWNIAWSSDGKWLASCSMQHPGTKIRIWNAATFEPLSILEGHAAQVTCVAWSPDGKFLASGSADKSMRLWDAGSGQCLKTLEFPSDIWSLAWRPDGHRMAVGLDDSNGHVYDIDSEESVTSFHSVYRIYSLAWSPDGAVLACTGGADIEIWDAELGVLRYRRNVNPSPVHKTCWSPDGSTFVTCGEDGAVRFWDVKNGRAMAEVHGHEVRSMRVLWSPDGSKLASSAGPEQSIQVWDFSSEVTQRSLDHLTGAMAWSPDSRELASNRNTELLWWNADTGSVLRKCEVNAPGIASLSWSPNGKTLAGVHYSSDPENLVRLWEVQSGKLLSVLRGHAPHVTDVAWSADSRLLASAGSDLIVWNAATGKPLGGPRPYHAPVAWLGGTVKLAAQNAIGHLAILDAVSGESQMEFEPPLSNFLGLAVSSDAHWIAAVSYDTTIHVWNVDDVQPRKKIVTAPFNVGAPIWNALAWSPKGNTLGALTCDGVARLWDPTTGALVATLVALRDGGYVALSPDGHYRGSPSVENELVYVVETDDAEQYLLSPDEFAKKYGWQNDPERVRLGE